MVNIKIIYDRKDSDREHPSLKRRTCFWKTISEKGGEELKGHNIDFISISDEINKYFQNDVAHLDPFLPEILFGASTDILIINWDSINGDPVYGSDKAYAFLNHYKIRMNLWIKEGGIVLLESQSGQHQLVEKAYKIFDTNIEVTTKINDGAGPITPNKKLQKIEDPILCNIPDNFQLKYKGTFEDPWFPVQCTLPGIQACDPAVKRRKLWQGWFEKIPNGWDPIFFNELSKPIMIRKYDSNTQNVGACVLSTMYIGSSDFPLLIKNIISLKNQAKKFYEDCESQKVRTKQLMKKITTYFVSILIIILFLWTLCFLKLFPEFLCPDLIINFFSSTLLGNILSIIIGFGTIILGIKAIKDKQKNGKIK